MATSRDDVKSCRLWRGAVAELVGTMLLVIIGCGTCVGGPDWEQFAPSTLQISLAFGLAVATVVWCLCHVAGAGHVNPAVTAGMLVTGKISVVRAVVFIVAQCLGAVVGAGLLKALTPPAVQGQLGATTVSGTLSVEQGFGVEFVVTFVLVLTVFASCDGKRKDLHGSGPLAIGLSVTLCHLFAIKYTGSSMNPARSFGPAVVATVWQNHWVYWCGPLLGGVTAALLYEALFAADASLSKVRYFLLTTNSSSSSSSGGSADHSVDDTKLHADDPNATGHEMKTLIETEIDARV